MQDGIRIQRRKIKKIMKQAHKNNQLTVNCRFDGQPEDKNGYKDDEPSK